ncbi:MAG: 1-acyl-sn-glycerol-3-phosphate acyltransferase [Aeromonas sp.]
MTELDRFADIRPYFDSEVPAAVARLIADDEFISAIARYRFGRAVTWGGWLLRPLLRRYLQRQWGWFTCVHDVQLVVNSYMARMVTLTCAQVTYSGLEQLNAGQGYLFVSNHRDIAMDPALVNWGLHQAGLATARIAIGDNLLSKPCATELMRLNKSFIVKRALKGPREMMKALGQLSAYISDSVHSGHSVWIAQKEGRAKAGDDRTDPALLKMFYVEGKKHKREFSEYLASLNLVPVSISYEWDPTDIAKARELHARASTGGYAKGEFEDIQSIITGIMGQKGRVHIAFGAPIRAGFSDANQLAELIDNAVWQNYRLWPSHRLAAGQAADCSASEQAAFAARLAEVPSELRERWRAMYAKPVENAAANAAKV